MNGISSKSSVRIIIISAELMLTLGSYKTIDAAMQLVELWFLDITYTVPIVEFHNLSFVNLQ